MSVQGPCAVAVTGVVGMVVVLVLCNTHASRLQKLAFFWPANGENIPHMHVILVIEILISKMSSYKEFKAQFGIDTDFINHPAGTFTVTAVHGSGRESESEI